MQQGTERAVDHGEAPGPHRQLDGRAVGLARQIEAERDVGRMPADHAS